MAELRLAELVPVLQQVGYPCEHVGPSADLPEDQLFILLSDEAEQTQWRLELIFMPGVDDPPLLQLFTMLPVTLVESATPDLARLTHRINSRLPLPGFGLSEGDGWVYYRLIIPCPRRAVDADLLTGTVGMIEYFLTSFGGSIVAVAGGGISLADATAQVEAIYSADA